MKCIDRQSFLAINSSSFSRMDLLTDESLCEILTDDELLHKDVHTKLKEFERAGKRINLINMCSSGNEIVNDLFHQLPRKARTFFEGNQYTRHASGPFQHYRPSQAIRVPKFELRSRTHLQSKVSELEQGLERMQMADSAVGSTEDSDIDKLKGREGMNPPAPMKWDIEEGDNDMLNEACRSGKLDIVKGILSSGRADINNKSEDGWTPVLIAIWKGYKQVFDVLVVAGCDLSVKLDYGNNIFHVACLGGNVNIENYIVSNRVVDTESKGVIGRTAVMLAAVFGQKKIFDYLRNKGCDMSGEDDDGNNILHLACIGGSTNIVRYIITYNVAGVESKGHYGRTPVMMDASIGQKKVFDLLVSEGCRLSGVDDTGNNILHLACFSNNVDIVRYIITHNITGADSKGRYGRTPVMMAASMGQKKVFDLLVSGGSDLSCVDDQGSNILHAAAIGGNVGVVEQILTDRTVDINSRNKFNMTPLKLARQYKHDDVVRLLLKRGAVDR